MAWTRACRTCAALFVLSMFAGGVWADGVAGFHAGSTSSCDDGVRARAYKDRNLDVGMVFPEEFDFSNLFCSFLAKNEGDDVKGVKVAFEAQVLDESGRTLRTFNETTRTKSNGYASFSFPVIPGAAGLTVDPNLKGPKMLNQFDVNCFASNVPPCQPDGTTLCLGDDGRFRANVEWRDFDNSTGPGMVLDSRKNEGSFYFFNPNNRSLIVELLNACGNNDHFWVFANALTNVEFELTVTDTATGMSRVYDNELGQVLEPITDTSAFATCP